MDTAALIAVQIEHKTIKKTIALKQLLHRLRIDCSLASMSCCADDLAIECWAESLGLTAESGELQAAVNRFRRANELLTPSITNEWLAQRGMTLDDLVALLKPPVMKSLVIRHAVSEEEIRRHFLEHAPQYDRAEISMIVTADYGVAQELLFRVEEGSGFHALARQYSSHAATVKAGGYAGMIRREDLEPEIAAAVFHASAGELLGPFERKREYLLILVEDLHPAELNESVAASVREQLFQHKLAAYRQKLDIREKIWSLGEG